MASRMQRLNVRLSYLLEDIVAAYTDDGQDYTSADRDLLLNTSSRILFDSAVSFFDDLYDRVKGRSRKDVEPVPDILKDFVITKLMSAVGQPAGRGFSDYARGNTDRSGLWLDDYPSGNVYRVKKPLRVVSRVSGGTDEWKQFKVLNGYDIPLSLTPIPMFSPSIENPICYVTFNVSGTAKYLRMIPDCTSGTAVVFSWLQYPNTDLNSGDTADIQWNSSFDTALLRVAYAVALKDDGKLPEYEAELRTTLMELGLIQNTNEDLAKQNLKGKP